MKEHNRPCEAPEHHPNCDGIGSTKDHFTPQCIAKLYRWKKKEIDAPENIQYLSPACHIEKDRTTPLRKEILKLQLQGHIEVPFGGHQRILHDERIPSSYFVISQPMDQGREYQIPTPSSSRSSRQPMRRSPKRVS